MTNHFNPPGLWAPNGRAFNQGVIQPEGKVDHVTGQVAWDENSQVVELGATAGAQLEKSLDNVPDHPRRSRWNALADIVSMTIYFLNRDDLPAI